MNSAVPVALTFTINWFKLLLRFLTVFCGVGLEIKTVQFLCMVLLTFFFFFTKGFMFN